MRTTGVLLTVLSDNFSAVAGRSTTKKGKTILVLALAYFSVALAACQQSSTTVDLTKARGCLAESGYTRVEAADLESSLPGFAAPNLAMEKAGLKVEAIVNGNAARAQRRLADLRGALKGFGDPEADARVVRVGNAVLLFTPAPVSGQRSQAAACFR